jgi:hypothetical protein
MSSSSFNGCVFVLGLAAGPAFGAPRTGELEVREGKTGVPCFTISQAEERRGGAPDFQSISVAEAGVGARSVVWSMAMPKARTFAVSFRMCIPYAGRLPVLPQTPAAALQPGRLYEVTIETRPPRAAGAAGHYRARFCLVREGQGELKVQSIGAGGLDAKARAACGA